MKGRKVRKRPGRPPKPPGEKAVGIKLWLSGRDAEAVGALAEAKGMTLSRYVVGLVVDDLAREAVGEESGPVTNAKVFELARAALDLAEKPKEFEEAKLMHRALEALLAAIRRHEKKLGRELTKGELRTAYRESLKTFPLQERAFILRSVGKAETEKGGNP
jgi:hypothetical protein